MAHLRSSRRKRKLPIDIDVIHVSEDELLDSSEHDSDVEVIENNLKIPQVDLTNLNNSNLEDTGHSGKVDNDVEIVEITSNLSSSSTQEIFSKEDKVSPSSGLDKKDIVIEQTIDLNVSEQNCDAVNINLDSTVSDIQQINDDCSEYNGFKEQIIDLKEEVTRLKFENEALRCKPCACNKDSSTNATHLLQDLIATINFYQISDYNIFKNNVLSTLPSYLKYDIKEKPSELIIEVCKFNTDVCDTQTDVVDIPQQKVKKKHKKKKQKREKVEDDLFVLDTTPNIQSKSNLQYQSKFSVTNEETEHTTTKNVLSNCFNCNGSHSLRECPHPKNYSKINTARQRLKGNQNKSVRYHLDDDDKGLSFKPGIISKPLRSALDLRDDQLPAHIYMMRNIGYPPGWFSELITKPSSDLMLFDFDGKKDTKSKSGEVDPEKIVEYSGFNMPLNKGVKDEYRFYGVAPYSKQCHKDKMLEYARKMSQNTKDDLEACDMDIEEPTSPTAIPSNSINRASSLSPTLKDLVNEQQKLISELNNANDDSMSNATLTQEENDTNDSSLLTLDATGTPDDLNFTVIGSQPNSPCPNSIKISRFGTPIISSLSPYSVLPRSENFQQNVSDLINFENLPNSTGKYEQMVGVLQKVRKQMQRLNSL